MLIARERNGLEMAIPRPSRAQPARSRACSMSATRSAWVAAIGATFSVVTPASAQCRHPLGDQ